MDGLEIKMLFDGWQPIIRTIILGTLAYISLVVLLRVSGKRTLSKMNAFDFVVTVAFGSTLAAILTNKDVSLLQGVVALSMLILLQLIITFAAVRSQTFQKLVKAQPTLLFYKGQFLERALHQERVTREEVLAVMRQEGVAEPSEVDAVVLETEGSLSIIRDGLNSQDNLEELGVNVDKLHLK